MTYVSRDPFAREELHRQSLTAKDGQTCDWCGQVRQGKGANYLFRYWIETDGGRRMPIKGLFCSVSCMRTFAPHAL